MLIKEDRKICDRVRRSVYPTTEILQFLCLKLLRVQGNRIIDKRARDSSGPIPLYNRSSKGKFINLSVFEVFDVENG